MQLVVHSLGDDLFDGAFSQFGVMFFGDPVQAFANIGRSLRDLVLSDEAIFTYKVDNPYAPQTEASIRWDDETIGIKWPVEGENVLLSDKDLNKALSFEEAEYFE